LRAFDCSGFVRWAFGHLGVSLPRRAGDQNAFGSRVERADLRFGDIVIFHHPKRGYHSGIYMDGNRFIHSSTSSRRVRYSDLGGAYFNTTFVGARRIAPGDIRPDMLTEQVLGTRETEKTRVRASVAGAKKAGAGRKASASGRAPKPGAPKPGAPKSGAPKSGARDRAEKSPAAGKNTNV
jgi:hypothetical protein